MPIVGGLDIHRKHITFDYLGTETGQVRRGQIARPTGSTYGASWPGSPAAMTSRSRDRRVAALSAITESRLATNLARPRRPRWTGLDLLRRRPADDPLYNTRIIGYGIMSRPGFGFATPKDTTLERGRS
jgi:hypothetical protein